MTDGVLKTFRATLGLSITVNKFTFIWFVMGGHNLRIKLFPGKLANCFLVNTMKKLSLWRRKGVNKAILNVKVLGKHQNSSWNKLVFMCIFSQIHMNMMTICIWFICIFSQIHINMVKNLNDTLTNTHMEYGKSTGISWPILMTLVKNTHEDDSESTWILWKI